MTELTNQSKMLNVSLSIEAHKVISDFIYDHRKRHGVKLTKEQALELLILKQKGKTV